MDNLFRLFCSCCGIQDNESSDLPYRPLGNDDIIGVRDPPIPNINSCANVHENGGCDLIDGHLNSNTNSPTPIDAHKSDMEQEKELLEGIVASTQHNIIAVGQLEHLGLGGREIYEREKKYENLLREHEQNLSSILSTVPVEVPDFTIEFEFEQSQKSIELPLSYEELVSSVSATPQERVPFACPNFQRLLKARPIGKQSAKIMEEPLDSKKAGKTAPMSKLLRQKFKEFAQEVHNGVEACQIEHKTNLVVYMDL